MRGKRAVLITGTRELPDRAGRALIARAFQGYKPDVIVVGCARGVDKFAREWAREFGITPLVSKADWKGLGKGAGYARNKDLVTQAIELRSEGAYVECWAFPSIESKGTWHCLRLAAEAGIPTTIVLVTAESRQLDLLDS